MILTVLVKPNACQTKITAWRDEGTVCVDIAAPPVDGKANQTLIKFLAKELKIPQSAITLKRGANSKVKHLIVPDETSLKNYL